MNCQVRPVSAGREAAAVAVLACALLASNCRPATAQGAAGLPERWRGEWIIGEPIVAATISAMTKAQARTLVGTKMVLGEHDVAFGKQACVFSAYAIEEEAVDDFLASYRLTAGQLPLPGGSVKTLNFNCPHTAMPTLQRRLQTAGSSFPGMGGSSRLPRRDKTSCVAVDMFRCAKREYRSLLAEFVCVAFAIAVSVAPPVAARGGDTHASTAAVTVLHFNDIYEIDAVEGGRSGGLARVATVLDELKRTSGPVLATLGGDYLSPSAIGTAKVDGEPLNGRQMVDVLNALGIDWATFGNHEFDLPEPAFHARLAEGRFRVVSSNVTDATGQPFEGTAPSAIVAVRAGGRTIRLGLIGLTVDANVKDWVKYAPPVSAAKAQVAALAGQVDALIALTHLSLAADQELAVAVPEIDLILGGHEHENWIIRRGPAFTPIVKADANARSVAIVTMTFGRPGERPTIAARLQVIDEHIPPKREVAAVVEQWTSIGFDAFRKQGLNPVEVVATVSESLDGRESTVRNRPSILTDLITAGVAHGVKDANVAIVNGGAIRVDDVLPPGRLTVYDIIRVLPFGGAVLRVRVDGALLASVLDIGAQNQGSGGYLQTWGVTRDARGWLVHGQPIEPGRRYTVGLPEYLLTGHETGLNDLIPTNPHVHDVQKASDDIRQVVIQEIRARYR